MWVLETRYSKRLATGFTRTAFCVPDVLVHVLTSRVELTRSWPSSNRTWLYSTVWWVGFSEAIKRINLHMIWHRFLGTNRKSYRRILHLFFIFYCLVCVYSPTLSTSSWSLQCNTACVSRLCRVHYISFIIHPPNVEVFRTWETVGQNLDSETCFVVFLSPSRQTQKILV